MRRETIDLILSDFTFFGIFPLLLGPRKDRPPVISISLSPLVLSSIDTSPLLGPATTSEERARNRQETQQFQASLASINEYLDNLLHGYGCPPLPCFCLDCLYTLPDLLLQLTADAFEFPRSDMPPHVKFVGPVLPKPSLGFRPPEWWKELDGSRPVVLVTQGTVANTDLNELIGPTVAGLSNENVMVIAATGKPSEAFTAPVPSNARVTPFIPFLELLPKVDVFVTNGGYGAVNQALSKAVPLVVAGETEDKVFVAARVAWSGAGINLRTSRPTPAQVRDAVGKVLKQESYRTKARALQTNFAQYNALERITRHLESLLEREQTRSLDPVSGRRTRPSYSHRQAP
jgi:MGT family glycosyltransferase